MGDKTNIEWTDATWNPIRGCSRVSEGCRNCYAESQANRFKGPGQPYEGLIAKGGQWNGSIKLVPEKLDVPLRWKKPRRIFVNSMSDLFHENVPTDFIDQIFTVMALATQHTFQILTKRPERMYDYLTGKRRVNGLQQDEHEFSANWFIGAMMGGGTIQRLPSVEKNPAQWANDARRTGAFLQEGFGWPLPNVWLGVSVEDQATADERIPLLLETPAAVRWISAEPLLGAIDLRAIYTHCPEHDFPSGFCVGRCPSRRSLDWVVAGGESGTGARPMNPKWARSLRDQCAAADVPFLFKQWGEWRPPVEGEEYSTEKGRAQRIPAFIVDTNGTVHCFINPLGGGGKAMLRIGKKAAGRLLDGKLHDEYPRTGAVA